MLILVNLNLMKERLLSKVIGLKVCYEFKKLQEINS